MIYLSTRTLIRSYPARLRKRLSYRKGTPSSAMHRGFGYGCERLPALVAGLGQSESWETLWPAVYGVSAAEFEAGWQLYLTTQYGL